MKAKPIPPANLWEELDKLLDSETPPSDAFSIAGLAERHGISYELAQSKVRSLYRRRKIVDLGKFGRHRYYRLAEEK